jgi:hypothetical protein
MSAPAKCIPGFILDPDEPSLPNPAPPDRSLLENFELIQDLARYGEGLFTREQVKRRWKKLITNEMWEALATDDELVDAIEAEKVRRVRDGSAKRELAQKHIAADGPNTLHNIICNERANEKHKIDAVKALDGLAGNTPDATVEKDRIVIRIDLGADIRAAGGTPGPKDVLEFEANPNPTNTIDHTPQPQRLIQQESTPPVRRGPGRPKGSKNKPKFTENDDDE